MIRATRREFTGRIIAVDVETVELPNGHVADLEIVRHPGGAAALAIDTSKRVCLIRQFRHAYGGYIWELPAGKLEPNEPPLVTAQRELIEEAGVAATQWRSLGTFVSSPGVFTETVHLFLAEGLTAAPLERESGEVIEVHWLDFADACHKAVSGELDDGKTALALLRARSSLNGYS